MKKKKNVGKKKKKKRASQREEQASSTITITTAWDIDDVADSAIKTVVYSALVAKIEMRELVKRIKKVYRCYDIS